MKNWLGRLNPKHWLSQRQPSQGVVEYGLMIGAVAVVVAAGATAIMNAQTVYWGGVAPSMASPTPSAGSPLHNTRVDLTCTPSTVKVGNGTISCSATVVDLSGVSPNPPWGIINWLLDGNIIPGSTCAMPHWNSGNSNTCGPFVWQPLRNSTVGSHTLVAQYAQNAANQSNHSAPQSSPTVTLQVDWNLKWTVGPLANGCVNDVKSALSPNQVEPGLPLRCSITLLDGSAGAGLVPVPTGTTITWSTENDPLDPGVGMWTCDTTTAPPMWSGTFGCASPVISDPASFDCQTDATGTCSAVYRRLYDTAGKALGPANIWLSVTLSGKTPPAPSVNGITVVPPQSSNTTDLVPLCTSHDPAPLHLVVQPVSPAPTFGNATFSETNDLDIYPVTPPVPSTTTLKCTVTVYDQTTSDPSVSNNPAVRTAANPNLQEAFPPVGTVTFTWYDGTNPIPVPIACSPLVRLDFSPSNPAQAPGQAPFMSTCSTPIFSISGTVNDPNQEAFNITYNGDGTHKTSTKQVNIDFH